MSDTAKEVDEGYVVVDIMVAVVSDIIVDVTDCEATIDSSDVLLILEDTDRDELVIEESDSLMEIGTDEAVLTGNEGDTVIPSVTGDELVVITELVTDGDTLPDIDAAGLTLMGNFEAVTESDSPV